MSADPDLSGEAGWTPTELFAGMGVYSFVSGDSDGDRMRVRYYRGDHGVLHARCWFGPRTQGPPGHAHGGSMAALIDETMGGAAWLAGHPVVAVELVTRFKSLLPLDTVATMTAEIVEARGRKVRTTARIEGPDGTLHAEGEGLFLALEADTLQQLGDHASGVLGKMR